MRGLRIQTLRLGDLRRLVVSRIFIVSDHRCVGRSELFHPVTLDLSRLHLVVENGWVPCDAVLKLSIRSPIQAGEGGVYFGLFHCG